MIGFEPIYRKNTRPQVQLRINSNTINLFKLHISLTGPKMEGPVEAQANYSAKHHKVDRSWN